MENPYNKNEIWYYFFDYGQNQIYTKIYDKRMQGEEFKILITEINQTIEDYKQYPKIRYFLDELFIAIFSDDNNLYFDQLNYFCKILHCESCLDILNLRNVMINYFLDDGFFMLNITEDWIFLITNIDYIKNGDTYWPMCNDPKLIIRAAKFNANKLWEKINNPKNIKNII